ncbi:MAG: ParB N-terminal domain-containing protein [Thaumarchaeota archaeon]|nr:ParB N-terminal domain-containing protein [Candidatus Calditenuaceae archaeon]MDW8187172.1 ParB N-terminal domain-containing protein [Nitrososphaerota archaeon]
MGRLAFVEVGRLRPHEEVVEELVGSIMNDLLSTGRLLHPIVVEESHGMILDGSHRFEALRRLGAKRILAYTVDYFSEEVELKAWYRVIDRRYGIEDVLEALRSSLNAVFERSSLEDGLEAVRRRRGAVLLLVHGSEVAYLMPFGASGVDLLFREVARVDEALRRFGIRYNTEANVISGVRSGVIKLGYAVPVLEKREVVDAVMRGKRFPPKSTRHLVHGRLLYTLTPLEVITTEDESIREQFLKDLMSAETVSLGPGYFIDRFYEERIRVVVHRGLRDVPYTPEISELIRLRSEGTLHNESID